MNFMEQSTSEYNSDLASQEALHLLWNLNSH
jgi:hypothetical protein